MYSANNPKTWPDHDEVVITFNNGEKEYIDPVWTVTPEGGELVVDAVYEYRYDLDTISHWEVRKFTREIE